MSVSRRIAGLLDIATEDARGAVSLSRERNRNSAYLCPQAAEKLIKAVLLDHGIEAGAEHHLDTLVARLPAAPPSSPPSSPIEVAVDVRRTGAPMPPADAAEGSRRSSEDTLVSAGIKLPEDPDDGSLVVEAKHLDGEPLSDEPAPSTPPPSGPRQK
jgi:hypothetical protein